MTLRIVLLAPPAGIDYALQQGSGNRYESVQTQRSQGRDLTFEFPVRYEKDDYYGPFIQGRKGERFVYIGIGTYAGQTGSAWSRRLKVPVTGCTADATWETRVPGTGRDGGPNCATVKPFPGWTRL